MAYVLTQSAASSDRSGDQWCSIWFSLAASLLEGGIAGCSCASVSFALRLNIFHGSCLGLLCTNTACLIDTAAFCFDLTIYVSRPMCTLPMHTPGRGAGQIRAQSDTAGRTQAAPRAPVAAAHARPSFATISQHIPKGNGQPTPRHALCKMGNDLKGYEERHWVSSVLCEL